MDIDQQADSQGYRYAIQWPCHGDLNQRFDIVAVEGTWHRIKSKYSGKCLDVKGGSTLNNAEIIEWTCHSGYNQQFQIPSTGGSTTLRVRHSNKCIEVPGSSQSWGLRLKQQTCDYDENQLWLMGDSANDTYNSERAPFTGWWDRFGLSHPSVHGLSQCEPGTPGTYSYKPACGVGGLGDWSLDYYQGSGTRVDFFSAGYGGPVTARVWAITSTCGAGASAAGYTVFVDVYISGIKQGWVAFGHLTNVQVSPQQWISWGQPLGYLYLWQPQVEDCWEVSNNNGVHTHIEMYNVSAYACYVNRTSGSYISYTSDLGHVGRSQYTGQKQAC